MGKLYNDALNFINNWKENKNEILEFDKKVSVVIPVYHPKYLKEVLERLSKLNNIFEVVMVFDSNDDNPNEVIGNYNFKLKIIKHDRNRNAPGANNTGAAYATGDILLFLDQDMILSPQFIPKALNLLNANDYNGLVVGFRDTVKYEDVPLFENWKESNYKNDWRIETPINNNYLDLTVSNCGSSTNNCNENSILKIYENTDKFRNLGIKREFTIGFWDLACMVISHTLAIPRKHFINIGGFPEWIIGWGGEDIALGFLAVSHHLLVIPVEIGSYHIMHSSHSGSEEKKWEEMRNNLKKYKEWSISIDENSVLDEKKCKERGKIIYKSF